MHIKPNVAAINYIKQWPLLNDPAKWRAVATEFDRNTNNAQSGICACFEELYGYAYYWACCSFFKLIRDTNDYVWPPEPNFRSVRAAFCREVAAQLESQPIKHES